MCQTFLVAGLRVICPDWLPRLGWSIHDKGYVIYTSRKIQPLIRRGARMHRIILQALSGALLHPDDHIHHMDYDKLNNCPSNLVRMPFSLNPSPVMQARCPYTGRFYSLVEMRRQLGRLAA